MKYPVSFGNPEDRNEFNVPETLMCEMQARFGPAEEWTSHALGPYLVTLEEFDIGGVSMTAEVDSETWSEATDTAGTYTPGWFRAGRDSGGDLTEYIWIESERLLVCRR